MLFRNVGSADRWIRLIVGIALLGGVWAKAGGLSSAAAWFLGIIGAVLALTGVLGDCLIYKLFGISTRKS